MFDLLSKLFDKHTWFNLIVIVTMVILFTLALTSFLYYFPVEFELSTKEIKEETYYLHKIVYKSWSTIEDGRSTVVHLQITDTLKKEANNLVSK